MFLSDWTDYPTDGEEGIFIFISFSRLCNESKNENEKYVTLNCFILLNKLTHLSSKHNRKRSKKERSFFSLNVTTENMFENGKWSKWCVLSLIAQTKNFSPRFPISLLHSSHQSCTRRKPHLVWRGVHSAVWGERPKFHDFSKIAGDVPLWKIVSRDLLGQFGWEYACWKGHIVYF